MSLSVNRVGTAPVSTCSFQARERKNNLPKEQNKTLKVLAGLGALAALGTATVLLHNSRAAKKAFQEGFNHVEPVVIKETAARKNANEMIDRVEMLKRNEGGKYAFTDGKGPSYRDIGRYPKAEDMEKVNWDAKPISRNQALFERKFYGDAKLPYINPDYQKEIAKFEEFGGKVHVKDLKNGEKEITYIYPENSVFESKTVRGKVADIEKGHDFSKFDEKRVCITLKESEGGHTYGLVLRNNFRPGDGGKYEILFDGANQWGYIKSEDVLKGSSHFINCGNLSKQSEEAVSKFFQKELGLA